MNGMTRQDITKCFLNDNGRDNNSQASHLLSMATEGWAMKFDVLWNLG